MKLGPYQRTPKELKDQIGEARRIYNVGKQDLYERSVTAVENNTNLGLGLFFVCLLLMVWMIALYWPITIQKLYEAFGIYPVIVIFFVSYFAFFLVSRFILKPSDEELADSSS
ncbi:MAG: hypothetical protein ABJA02_03485 [Acidobacteriota bacterium]